MRREHEFVSFLNDNYYQDNRVSEAIADFFGVLFSLCRVERLTNMFDMQVADKRYKNWKEREGSGWPYAYALHFLNKPYKSDIAEYTETELEAAYNKLGSVFVVTIDPKDSFNKLEN